MTMPTYARVLAVLAVVAACVALSASAAVDSVTGAELQSTVYMRLSNSVDDPYPTDIAAGETEGRNYYSPTLTGGTFTIQGATAQYTVEGAPTGYVWVEGMTVSNGNVVITGYLPVGTRIVFSNMQGTAAANTPMISTVNVPGLTTYSVEVVDSTVAWSAAETTPNTQVLLAVPRSNAGPSNAFVLGASLTGASAVVSTALEGGDASPTTFSESAVLAVDYVSCNGCANGIVYISGGALGVSAQAMVRVSHVTVASSAVVTLLNTGNNALTVFNNGLVVVENVSSTLVNVFSGTVAPQDPGKVVLRYLNVNAVGATLPAGATYANVVTQTADGSLDAATQVVDQCPAACLNGGTLATPQLSCTCTCTDTVNYFQNFCTAVSDPLRDYTTARCGNSCRLCYNETTCTTCQDGYTLNALTGQCQVASAGCPANCRTCSATGVCSECETGYVLTAANACVACGVANCATCAARDPNTCTACTDGSAPVQNVCPNACTDAHCLSCPVSAGTCARCEDSYGVVAGACQSCADPNCLTCNGNVNTCTTCADTYFPTVYGTCSPVECNLLYCLSCSATDATKCATCQSPRTPDTVTGSCINAGDCSVANCATCVSGTAARCATCNTGYDLSADGTTCTSSSPSTCNVANCVTCVSGSPNRCATCATGYYASNGQCVRSGSCYVANCAQCMLRDSTKCSVCTNGYLLSSSYTCLSQHVNAAAAPRSLWVAVAVLVASAITYLA